MRTVRSASAPRRAGAEAGQGIRRRGPNAADAPALVLALSATSLEGRVSTSLPVACRRCRLARTLALLDAPRMQHADVLLIFPCAPDPTRPRSPPLPPSSQSSALALFSSRARLPLCSALLFAVSSGRACASCTCPWWVELVRGGRRRPVRRTLPSSSQSSAEARRARVCRRKGQR